MRSKPNTLLHKVRLNQGGYTAEGYYFGAGPQLWYYMYDHEGIVNSGYVRARTRELAKEAARRDMNRDCRPVFYR